MGAQVLQNVKEYETLFQIPQENPSYLALLTRVTGRRMKRSLQLLLSYQGVGEIQVPGAFIAVVPDITEFPVNEVAEILDISRSTYYRLKEEPQLDPETADKISSLLKLFYQGLEAFEGNQAHFRDWMHTGIPNLANKKPVHLLKTESGRMAVLDAIGRVEHNVYG